MPIRVPKRSSGKRNTGTGKYICDGRVQGCSSGYPSAEYRASESDAAERGYGAPDSPVTV